MSHMSFFNCFLKIKLNLNKKIFCNYLLLYLIDIALNIIKNLSLLSDIR